MNLGELSPNDVAHAHNSLKDSIAEKSRALIARRVDNNGHVLPDVDPDAPTAA